MVIKRRFAGGALDISLTEEELRQAHREYAVGMYKIDVKSFIEVHLKLQISDIEKQYDFGDFDILVLANQFYEEKMQEQTNIYSMAKVVIPYLEEKGVNVDVDINDFQNMENDLNCI